MSQRLEFVHAVLHREPGESIATFADESASARRPAISGSRASARRPRGPGRSLARAPSAGASGARRPSPTPSARCAKPSRPGARANCATCSRASSRRRRGPRRARSRLYHPRRLGDHAPPLAPRASAWARSRALTHAAAPNEVWTADFKGEFRLGHGPYCYPAHDRRPALALRAAGDRLGGTAGGAGGRDVPPVLRRVWAAPRHPQR